jgi:hypothetical protein
MGKMFGKPPIARKLCRIPSNFLLFAPIGSKCKLSSMHLADCLLCIMGLYASYSSSQCVHAPINSFLKGKPNSKFEKIV